MHNKIPHAVARAASLYSVPIFFSKIKPAVQNSTLHRDNIKLIFLIPLWFYNFLDIHLPSLNREINDYQPNHLSVKVHFPEQALRFKSLQCRIKFQVVYRTSPGFNGRCLMKIAVRSIAISTVFITPVTGVQFPRAITP